MHGTCFIPLVNSWSVHDSKSYATILLTSVNICNTSITEPYWLKTRTNAWTNHEPSTLLRHEKYPIKIDVYAGRKTYFQHPFKLLLRLLTLHLVHLELLTEVNICYHPVKWHTQIGFLMKHLQARKFNYLLLIGVVNHMAAGLSTLHLQGFLYCWRPRKIDQNWWQIY